MAIWQCDFQIRPRRALEVEGTLPLSFSRTEETEFQTLWNSNFSLNGLPNAIAKFLPECSSWSKQIRSWGTEDGDRIDLSGDKEEIEEWFVRFDLRHPNFSFIHAVIELAERYDGVFVSSRNYVIPPSYTKLLDHIRRSSTFRFVEDPEKFFSEISSDID